MTSRFKKENLTMDDRLTFEYNCCYEITIPDNKFHCFSIQDTHKFIKTGSVFGKYSEQLLSTLFTNLELSKNDTTPYDLINTDTHGKIELKSSGGTNIFNMGPAKMYGINRTYDYDEHLERYHTLEAYILCDKYDYPTIRIVPIPKYKIGCLRHIIVPSLTRSKFNRLTTFLETEHCYKKTKLIVSEDFENLPLIEGFDGYER